MVVIMLATLYILLGGTFFNFGVSASAVPSGGIKLQSMFEPGSPAWHMALPDDAHEFMDALAAGPMLPARTYYGNEGVLSGNTSHMSIRDGLLYSLDEYGPDSEFVEGVNKHLTKVSGLNIDITAPQILAAVTGLVIVAGLACVFIPGCIGLFATNLGSAIHAFHVAAGGSVTGDAGGVVVGLATAAASAARSVDKELDFSKPGMIGYDGYYVSLELHDHISHSLQKRDQFEDENFACIFNDGWAGVCHNEAVLKPMLSSVLNHDVNDKDSASCWEVKGSGEIQGWYYHCMKPNKECSLPCNHGAPLPPFPCANLNDKGGSPWTGESDKC